MNVRRLSVKKVNLLSVELDEPLDEHGFRHVAATVGPRLGAHRIGAGVYQAEAGSPIWPYHYHHGVEEWLYVIEGAPVLREPAGERALKPGDLVCFPTGPLGAHSCSASRACARCSYRRLVYRPTPITRTPGTG